MVRASLALLLATFAAPALASTAADVCPAAANPCVVSTARTVTAGSTLDFGTRQLDVRSTGSITAVGSGLLTILAGSVRLETHARLIGAEANGAAASIKIVTTGDVSIETGSSGAAMIGVSADDSPGQVDIMAGGNIVIAGDVDSAAETDPGSGGTINVFADGNVTVSGTINGKGGLLGLGGAITIRAGGSASVPGIIRADAADGGDIEVEALGTDVSVAGETNVSAGGNFGDGGSLVLTAARNVGMSGLFRLGAAGSDLEGGGTGGDVSVEATAGAITLGGTVDAHGASPDGDGGEFDAVAGTDYVQAGDFDGTGNGVDGCGGFFSASVGRQLTVSGSADVSGGFCGGDIVTDGPTNTVAAAGEFMAIGGYLGGSVSILSQSITAAGRLETSATVTGGTAGQIDLTGCTLNVPSGALVRTDGAGGLNLFQASGQLTIGGTVQARTSGHNRFEYKDPSKPPVTLGSAVIQPTRDCAPAPGCLNSSLVACAASAVCGNNVREPGEDCDDANTTPCDGCSPSCRTEGCGNGIIECGEECDDGFSNGAPGDPCDADCHVVTAANVVFIPGAHRGGNGCMLEWALNNTSTGGFPSSAQSCIDGDPICDFDGVTDGGCTFHVSACLNVTDARLPLCGGNVISYVKVRKPNPNRPIDDLDESNADQLVNALGALGITVRAGDTVLRSGAPDAQADHCSPTFVQRILHAPGVAGRRLMSAGATSTVGERTSNRVSLACLPNPAVCGNGAVEISEQCDDGNTNGCDGCGANCRIERCGDGVIQCGEQCDDGLQNGTPGAPCSATCSETPPANRIPGGSGSRDCFGEFSLAAGQLRTSRNGLPTTKQICVDQDPSCDFDPVAGSCRFHAWVCVGGEDTRIECAAETVAGVTLLRPSPTQTGFNPAARQALLDGLDRFTFPAGPGEVCSPRTDLDVPAGRAKLQVKVETTTTAGVRDRDSLKLNCAPVGTVP